MPVQGADAISSTKDGPVDPSKPSHPTTTSGPIQQYAWWVSGGLARGSSPTPAEVSKLKTEGFKSVVDLRAESNDDAAPSKQAGLNYLQIPLVDNTAPTEAQMKQFLDFVTNPANQPAYVHCLRGIGRTGVAVACYQMAVEGMAPQDALKQAESFGLDKPAQIVFIQQFGADLAAGKITGYPLSASSPDPKIGTGGTTVVHPAAPASTLPGSIPGTFIGASGATIPDHQKTPGAVLTTNVSDIASPDWSKNHRDVLPQEKDQVDALYGFHGDRNMVEYDHLISLELGGSNDIANLWPEPIAEAHIKDKFENWLHDQVVTGKIPLVEAQKGIAGDWQAYAQSLGAPADTWTIPPR